MSNLVSNSYIVVLLILVPIMAYLIYLCALYKARINNLLGILERVTSEMGSIKEDIASLFFDCSIVHRSMR